MIRVRSVRAVAGMLVRKWYTWAAVGVVGLCVAGLLGYVFVSPAADRAVEVEVPRGVSGQEIAAQLETANVVRSGSALFLVLTLFYEPRAIEAGVYRFAHTPHILAVARTLAAGPQTPLVRLTFPEGLAVRDYAEIAAAKLSDFNRDVFIEAATPHEGFLFPDTYFVPPDFTARELLTLMREEFDTVVPPLVQEATNTPYSLPEIVTLASILEREANSKESMRLVSGILQARLDAGMLLQADATIEYVLDKPLRELTPADLERDTPYNTYRSRGLPPTPIGNPGLTAIRAVLSPAESPYLFYLTAPDGTFYYARTYETHKENIRKYLQ